MFLNENSMKTQPFFMVLAPPAAHAPFTPANRHKNKLRKLKALRNSAFNYTSLDVSYIIRFTFKSNWFRFAEALVG